MCEDIILQHGAMGRPPAKVPCIECPLRKDAAPGALGGWTPTQYLKGLHGPADIACHLSKGFASGDHARQRSCTGVAAYRAAVGWAETGVAHPLSHARVAVDQVKDFEEGRALSFDNPNAFILHHHVQEGQDADWWVLPNGRDPNKPCGGDL